MYLLVYRGRGKEGYEETLMRLFEANEIVSHIHWILGTKNRRWFTLTSIPPQTIQSVIDKAQIEKKLRDKKDKLSKLMDQQDNINHDISELIEEIDRHGQA